MRCKLFSTKKYVRLKVIFEEEDGENARKVIGLFGVERFNRLNVERKDGKTVCVGVVTTDKDIYAGELTRLMAQNGFIREIERCDDE